MRAKELKKYLDKANKVIANRNSLPILDNILFKNNSITVSDLEVSYTFKNDIFNVTGMIDFRQFYKVISKLKDVPFELLQTDTHLIVKTEKGDLKLKIDDRMEDYPQMGGDYSDFGNVWSNHITLIQKALKYVAKDELRPVMNCISMDAEGYVVATDAHYLCYYKTDVSTPENYLVRSKTAQILMECQVLKSNNGKFLKFETDNECIEQRVLDSNFPSWRSVIPENKNVLEVNTIDLSEKLDLCMLVNNSSFKTEFNLGENCTVRSEDIDFDSIFEGPVKGVYSGEELRIGFQSKRLQHILKTEKYKTASFSFSDPARAIIINDELLLMPIML